jgi:hypothetical protein
MKVRVLKYSNPHAAMTLRLTERSRASAGSAGTAPGRRPAERRSVVTGELIGLQSPERHGRRGRHHADMAGIGHCDLQRVTSHRWLIDSLATESYMRAPNGQR